MMQLLEHLLVVPHLLLSIPYVALEADQELGGLHLLESPFYSLMLFYQVLDRLVCVLDFFLASTDFLGAWTVRVISRPTIRCLFLFERLLVHFVDK